MTDQKNDKSLVSAGAEKVALQSDFGTVYIKQTQDGQIMRPIKARMRLRSDLGQIYQVGGTWALGVSGYLHLNKTASISIITPPDVSVGGQKFPNPYVERNPRTKAIETVNIRKIGFGYSPAGNAVIIDKTLYYNIDTYFIQSIQAVMKRRAWDKTKNKIDPDTPKHPNAARIGHRSDRPKGIEGAKWTFFETASPLGIWINYLDPAIQGCLEEHTQRQRFGDRIAQSIVTRNILKDHPAIGIVQVEPTTSWEVDNPNYKNWMNDNQKRKKVTAADVVVYGWRTDITPQQIEDVAARAEAGDTAATIEAEVIDKVPPAEEREVIDHEKTTEGPGGLPFDKEG